MACFRMIVRAPRGTLGPSDTMNAKESVLGPVVDMVAVCQMSGRLLESSRTAVHLVGVEG